MKDYMIDSHYAGQPDEPRAPVDVDADYEQAEQDRIDGWAVEHTALLAAEGKEAPK